VHQRLTPHAANTCAASPPGHADPIADEPGGPALQLSVDGGIWLRSNGQPRQLTADTAVHTDGYPAGRRGRTWSTRPTVTSSSPSTCPWPTSTGSSTSSVTPLNVATIHLHPGGLRIGAGQEADPRRF
jgi:hypothetical protein